MLTNFVKSVFCFFSLIQEAREMEKEFYNNRPDLKRMYHS